MAARRLIINGSTVEAPDGVLTVFTVPFAISDVAEFWVFTGTPGELATQVSPGPPAVGEYTIVGQVLTFNAADAPTSIVLRYFTTDLTIADGDAALVSLSPTGDPLVWTLPQKAKDKDSIELMYGTPGAMIHRVDSAPNFSEYTVDSDLLTVHLGLALDSGSQLRALIIAGTTPAAAAFTECKSKAAYLRMAKKALAKITQWGAAMTHTQTTTPTYDPQTGSVSAGSSSFEIRGLIFPIEKKRVGGTSILGTDQQVLAKMDTAPRVEDFLSIDGTDYRVVHVEALAPGCIPVLYDMAVRA